MRKFKSFIALDLKYNAQNISIVKKLHYHVYGFKVGYRSFYNKRSNDLISEIKKKKSNDLVSSKALYALNMFNVYKDKFWNKKSWK